MVGTLLRSDHFSFVAKLGVFPIAVNVNRFGEAFLNCCAVGACCGGLKAKNQNGEDVAAAEIGAVLRLVLCALFIVREQGVVEHAGVFGV